MRVLGIETSCDETGLAVVENGRLVAQQLATQGAMHAVFGGVVPELASREHLRTLDPLWQSLLEATGLEPEDFDAVAVARGPGLLGSLLVGLGFAKGLVVANGAQLIGVDHLVAHLLAPGLERTLQYPCLGLLVSGGHTQLYTLQGPTQVEVLGSTLDDAAGEAFDKFAKLLNLPYPGGKHVDQLGALAEPDPELLPVPYVDNRNLDFSFSGLKTAAAQIIQHRPGMRLETMPKDADIVALGRQRPELARLCASFNWAVARALRNKTARALARFPETQQLIVAGGVAANSVVRREMAELAQEAAVDLVLPSLSLCTDNAAMIAYAGECFCAEGLAHGLELEAVPRGQRVPWDYLPQTGTAELDGSGLGVDRDAQQP
ncbi:MAG: tRNA (adenosine(37)-N6)-threonylcarbamoyltransferase complex transferase subunit TsaD [Thermodesulfobacteriota bacterium]